MVRGATGGAADDAAPDVVVVGHVVRDLVPGGERLGGTATYAALTAARLGARIGVVTAVDPDLDLVRALPGARVVAVPSERTTTFENVYGADGRRQWVRSVASPIADGDVPAAWWNAPVVLLGPLVGEVAYRPGRSARSASPAGSGEPAGLLAATAQGWLRRWGPDGAVSPRTWTEAFPAGAPAPIVIVSEDDVGRDEATVEAAAAACDLLVLTRGARGADLYHGGKRRVFAAFPAVERDATGAGDVFAAAFLWRLRQTGDPAESVVFANAAGSLAVEAAGVAGVPTLERIAARRAAGDVSRSDSAGAVGRGPRGGRR